MFGKPNKNASRENTKTTTQKKKGIIPNMQRRKIATIIENMANNLDESLSSFLKCLKWLYIYRSVVMIDSNATVNGTTVWVSAGAEYNNDEEIWIGQASFETIVEEFVRNQSILDYLVDQSSKHVQFD